MTTMHSIQMSDRELLTATMRAARDESRAKAELVALLAEVDARRLYLGEGCSSLFSYCTQVLHLSEHAAYHRMEAARAAREYPVILELLRSGDVTLTTVAMLRPHLTSDNHQALLGAARHKSKRDVEYQIACLAPKADTKALIRRVPEGKPVASDLPTPAGVQTPKARAVAADTCAAGTSLVPPASSRPTVAPLAADRYLLRVTLSASAHAKLRRAQDLLRHKLPSGDPATILERALDLLVDQLEKAKNAKTSRPRSDSTKRATPPGESRHIPAPVRRAVWARDQGRCAFVGPHGRCTETGCLEYHHVTPFARGGSTSLENIALRCRAHNVFESELVFGRWTPPAETSTRSGPS
jgi:HNH endonuclease